MVINMNPLFNQLVISKLKLKTLVDGKIVECDTYKAVKLHMGERLWVRLSRRTESDIPNHKLEYPLWKNLSNHG